MVNVTPQNSQIVRIDRHELPDGLVALTFADPAATSVDGAELPLVFVMHGLLSRKEQHLDLCLRLARAGFQACVLDARLHGDRQGEHSSALWGKWTEIDFMLTFARAVSGTIADVRALADHFSVSRYGIVGHSMGGLIAVLTAIEDKRAAAVVNVGGSILVDVPPPMMTYLPNEARGYLRTMDILGRAGELWPTALLLQHGDQDETIPIAGARRLRAAAAPYYAADPDRLVLRELPGHGHGFSADVAEAAVAWMQRYR